MKKLFALLFLITLVATSCTTEEKLFEMEEWWSGHWQNTDETSLFFSSGTKRVGIDEIVTSQFFISQNDSILQNFHLVELQDFNNSDKYKVILTNEDTYIRIQEINESSIEIQGPADSINELESIISEYIRLPDNIEPPIPDSILYVR